MAAQLTLHPAAEREIETACDHYDRQAPGLALAFVLELAALIEAILRHPEMYPAFDEGYHRALMRRFPYQVLYYIDPTGVLIACVVHQHREPGGVSQSAVTRRLE